LTVLQDSQGNFVAGKQSVMDLAFLPATLVKHRKEGIQAATSFSVPPGSLPRRGDPWPQARAPRPFFHAQGALARRGLHYKASIRLLPCAVCRIEGRSEAAHTGGDGGMSMKASDYSCMPLCADCHRQAPGAYHRIGKRAFERAHGLCFTDVVARLHREWSGKCA